MSTTLRVVLFIAGLLTAMWILNRIRRLKVKMEDAIFWMVLAAVLCILSVFPQVAYKLTDLLGVMSPANFVFLVIISLLLEKVFTLSIQVSQLEDKVTVLSAEVALRSHSASRQAAEEGTARKGHGEAVEGSGQGKQEKTVAGSGQGKQEKTVAGSGQGKQEKTVAESGQGKQEKTVAEFDRKEGPDGKSIRNCSCL